MVEYPKLFIGGEWVPPQDGGLLESIDPATGKPWASVAFGGPADIDRAVEAARKAFGQWSRKPGHERARGVLVGEDAHGDGSAPPTGR